MCVWLCFFSGGCGLGCCLCVGVLWLCWVEFFMVVFCIGDDDLFVL